MSHQANSAPVITAANVAAHYRKRIVWQGADFSIGKGEFVGILGPNGAGKTTLFRMLLGLLHPAAGELQLLGEVPRRGHPRVGYVPQRRPIDSEMTIDALEFVRLGLYGNRWGFGAKSATERSKAQQALAAVGGEALAGRPLGTLSGGELQRVFLAQALVGKPDVLLLDEPLSNLDIRRETSLVQLVNKVVREHNVTALLIAHNLNPLLPVMDRIIYIANGRVATGTPEEVITSPSLTKLYGAPVEVLRDSRGRLAVVGIEEAAHPHV